MRFCRPIILATAASSALIAGPAWAREPRPLPPVEETYRPAPVIQAAPLPYTSPAMAMHYGQAGLPPQPVTVKPAYSEEERETWLRDCRRNYGDKDNGLGGALIGGVLGGVAGNVVAGKGNRTIGTVVGATVGAVAGAAIDKGEDKARIRDFCEDYLTRYEGNAPAYAGAAYPYAGAYNGQVMWMPVVVGWNCKPREKLVEEWVEERPARRAIPAKTAPAKTKYVPVRKAPTKTVPAKARPIKSAK